MKVLVVISEDWFVLSHFRPLLEELALLAEDVVVTTRSSGRMREIERLGVRTRSFHIHRGSLNVRSLRNAREELARIIDEEKPEVVHAIAMQTIVTTSLALIEARHRPTVLMMHLVGLGYLGYRHSPIALLLRQLAVTLIRRSVSKYNTWLLAENADDLDWLAARAGAPLARAGVVPGAGVDPRRFPELPAPENDVPRVAFVGRILVAKGLDVLVRAHQDLLQRGLRLELTLFGSADSENRSAIPERTLERWNRLRHVKWCGSTTDIVKVWQEADRCPAFIGGRRNAAIHLGGRIMRSTDYRVGRSRLPSFYS